MVNMVRQCRSTRDSDAQRGVAALCFAGVATAATLPVAQGVRPEAGRTRGQHNA